MMLSLQSERAVHSSTNLEYGEAMPYRAPMSFETINEAMSYDPLTGVFTWKISPAKNVRAGTEAGYVKTVRGKKDDGRPYRYVRLIHEVSAGRVAWLLHYGEWPTGKLFFKDGDTLNLRIDNLVPANSLPGKYNANDRDQRIAYLKDHRGAFPKAWKNSHLMSNFGITLAEYAAIAAKQDNKCAICNRPETEMRAGKVKALAVDHNHETGVVRGLLCVACNTGIGKLGEDRERLLAAIRYLDKHAGATKAAPNLTVMNGSDT